MSVVDGLNVDVTFSAALGAGATTATNYTLSGNGKGTLAANPVSVALASGNTYRLTWLQGVMLDGGDITITVANLEDQEGTALGEVTSATDAGGATATAPTVTFVAVQDALNVDVTFSRAMGSGATTATNYGISGTGAGALATNPSSVALVTGSTYRLTWTTGAMLNGGDVTITATGIKDAAGNTLGTPKSGTDAAGGVATAPAVTLVEVVDGLNVDVTFTRPMGTSATTATNYTLSGTGKGTLAANPTSVALVSGSKYRLTWASGFMLNAGNITITVAGVADAAGNALGTPDSGTADAAAVATAPTVTTVAVVDGLHVDVTFSKVMGTGVTTAANYALSGTGQGTLATNPDSVTNPTGNTYRLTWSSGVMLNGGDITVTVTGVEDAAGNTIGTPNSGTDSGAATATAPTVATVAVVDGLNVDVTFSKAMTTGVTTAANYTLSGTGKGTLAANPDSVALTSGNTYRLTWNAGIMFDGGNITVTVASVVDVAGNALGTPNSGTDAGGATATAPTVSTVAVVDGLNVDVTFSAAMGAGVTTAANYTLSGTGMGDLTTHPDSVALNTGNTYTLTWNTGLMVSGGDITITVAGAVDAAGNALGTPNSGTDTGGAVASAPTVSSVAVVDGLNVDVTFSRAMGTGVTTAANYTVSGTGQGNLANNPDSVALTSGTTYRLTWNAGLMLNGGDITVTVASVQDSVGNAIGSPNSGTDTGAAVATAPTVSSVAVVDGLNVDVTFSQAMGASAGVATNYALSGTGQGNLANNPDSVALTSGTTYRLTWSSGLMFDGGDITVTVTSVSDAGGNAIGTPNDGTDTGAAVAVAPTVTQVEVHNGTSVDVSFSQEMGNGATTAGNYTLSGTGQGSLANNPASVALVSGTTYRLTWAATSLMYYGGDITVTVAGVEDAGGNAIGTPNSGTDTGGAVADAPTVADVTVFDNLNVDVTFSQAMGTGVTTAANYTVSGTGQGSLANNPDSVALVSGNTYRLTWNAGLMVDGQAITITVANVEDAGGNAIGTPNDGTDTNGATASLPTVTAVTVVDGLNVDVTFNRAMGAGVTTVTNYALSGTGAGNLTANPDSVALNAGTTYRLTWNAGLMVDGGDITVTVTGVEDTVGNPIGTPNSGTDTGAAVATGPTVSGVAVVDGLNVDVTFSRAMGTGVTTATNYAVSGSGKGSLATNPTSVALSAGTTYRLTWASGIMLNGGNITITVNPAVQDSVGNTMGAPANGTDTGAAVAAAPTVSSVQVQTALTVDVTFSQAMGASATTAGNYTVSGSGQGTLTAHPDTAALVSGSTYRLTWSTGLMLDGGNITITVAGVLDAGGNALGAPDNATDTGGAVCSSPTVSSVSVPSALNVDVTFSQAMGAGVTTAGNYTISGTGKGNLTANPDSVALQAGTTYRLTWNTGLMVNGGDVTIVVTGVQDAAGNGILAPIWGTAIGGAITAGPTVTAVAVVDALNVDVTFSRTMGTGVTTASNYTVSGTGKGSLATNPSSVASQGGNVYRLTWASGLMYNGGDITITAGSGVKDSVGNSVGTPNSGTDAGAATATQPQVTLVEVHSGLEVDVTFDKAMGANVTTASKYTVSGTGKGSLAANPDSVALVAGNKYRLTWNSGIMFDGGDITITVDTTVVDAGGNALDGAADDGTAAGAATAAALSVSSVTVVDGLNVDVTFSAAMGAGVAVAGNYTLSGTGQGTLANNPNSVALSSGTTYRLTWASGLMFDGGDITITVAGVQDAGGNAIGVGDNATDTGGAVASAVVVSTVAVNSALTVDVTFNHAMGGAGVTTAGNYAISGTGQGTLAANPTGVALQGGNTYRLTWASGLMFIGGDITITVTNVTDAALNPISTSNSDNVGTDTGGATATDLAVTDVTVNDALTVDVTFNHAMGGDVTTATAYTLSGTGQGTLAANPDSVALQGGTTYRLTWNSGIMVIGGDITVTVAGVHDAANNPLDGTDNDTDAGAGTATVLAVSSVTVIDGLTVDVVFNQPMTSSEATTASNYTLSGTGKGTLAANPDTAALQDAATNKYRLTWSSGLMFNGGDVTVTVAGVHDEAGNAIGATDNQTDAGGAVATLPTVTGVAVQNETQVRVTFSRTMSGAALTVAGNYTVSGSGQGSLGNNPSTVTQIDGTTVELTWVNTTYMFDGGDITITVANAADTAGNVVDGGNNSATDTGGAQATAPTVVGVVRLDGTHIGVTFSKRMSGVTAINAANYSVTGGGNLGPAVLQGVGASVKITTDADPFGEELTITVNVTDSGGNPLTVQVQESVQ